MPRKSDTHSEKDTPASNNSNNSSAASGKDKEKDKDNGVSIDDHTLPKSIVTRLAKGVLPQNTNVQKDAILALSKGGTVFINYLCAAANDQAKHHGRKTINPKDVLEAMEQLEFGEFLPRLEAELDSQSSPITLPTTTAALS
ncbi:histone-fold-containing protein [Tuber borchii]|uniref:DNA polymerase epsilon subunit D n=1 Tax=Tuber borchii TaxID=42251 RepID=A0A2T6ZZZ8_TUBBO|nr:histone-fold-containing protein [Tuber borchii]